MKDNIFKTIIGGDIMLDQLFSDFGKNLPQRLAAVPVLAWVILVVSLICNFAAKPIAGRLTEDEGKQNRITIILKSISLGLLVIGFIVILKA